MANWRKTTKNGKTTTTRKASGGSSVSQGVVRGNNVNVNHRYTGNKTVIRTTYKSGGYVKTEQRTINNKPKKQRNNFKPRSIKSRKSDQQLVNATLVAMMWILALPFIVCWYVVKYSTLVVRYLIRKVMGTNGGEG